MHVGVEGKEVVDRAVSVNLGGAGLVILAKLESRSIISGRLQQRNGIRRGNRGSYSSLSAV